VNTTWYLGPLGDLRPLTCPQPGLSINPVRYGGVHQGLTGARTMDVTGLRDDYSFDYTYMDETEWMWLDALHSRHVRGPYRLINPLKKNRLTPRATSMETSRFTTARDGVLCPAQEWEYSTDFPANEPIPGRSLKLINWDAGYGYATFDQAKPIPRMTGETLTASAWLRAETTFAGASFHSLWYDKNGVEVRNGVSTLPTLTSDWTRWTITPTIPANAASYTFRVEFGDTPGIVYLAAPQVEVGTESTPWQTGGGAPEVLIDQLTTSSPRFPLRDATLTLLEA
jgi:hypothetical protein